MKRIALALSIALVGALGAVAAQANPPQPSPSPNVFSVPADLDATDPLGAQLGGPEPAVSSRPRTARTDRLRGASTPSPTASPTDSTPPAATRQCTPAAANPVVDGRPIMVQLPPAKPFRADAVAPKIWQNPPVSDPTWRLYFWSLRWMSPLVRRAQQDGQTASVEALLSQVVRFYRDNPDSGKAVLGWDEGGSLRRLETLNCLYSLTQDARLSNLMAKEVGLLFGPRYYGPPYHPVHNHGLMANLRILQAGRLLGRTDWVYRAGERMRSESRLSFTPLGTSYEQSAQYQDINAILWRDAAEALAAIDPTDPVSATIRATVGRAERVAQWLTEPDGRYVQIGDSARTPGPRAPESTQTSFRDDVAGLIIGRWSWKDPQTSYYTVRYGPPRRAHGHPDKTSVTWTTAGTRVLVGSGYFSYERANPFAAYQISPESANVAIPIGRRLDVRASATVHSSTMRATRHRYMLTDRVYGVNHSRSVDVDDPTRTLVVADAFPARQAGQQIWTLDPAWELASARGGARTAIFRHPDGRTLRVDTTGALASAVRGSTRPVAGWVYPAPQQRSAAWQLRIRWNGGTVRTTFQVR